MRDQQCGSNPQHAAGATPKGNTERPMAPIRQVPGARTAVPQLSQVGGLTSGPLASSSSSPSDCLVAFRWKLTRSRRPSRRWTTSPEAQRASTAWKRETRAVVAAVEDIRYLECGRSRGGRIRVCGSGGGASTYPPLTNRQTDRHVDTQTRADTCAETRRDTDTHMRNS